MGGWGLKKLDEFSSMLVMKLGWQLVALDSLWTKVAYSKYIAPARVVDWIRRPTGPLIDISTIWKVVLKALEPIRSGITWRIHLGTMYTSTLIHGMVAGTCIDCLQSY